MHIRQRLSRQIATQSSRGRSPRRPAIDLLGGIEAQHQPVVGRLHDLETVHLRGLLDDGGQRQRQEPHDTAVRRVQRDHVVAPSLDLDRRKRAAAAQGSGFAMTLSPRSYLMIGWTRLARLVSRTVCEGSPGGTGRYSASTGSSSTQSALTCSQPWAQPKAMLMHSDAPYSLTTRHPNARSISAAAEGWQALAARP